MVQRIENWSTLRGEVRAVADDPERSDFRRVSIAVAGIEPVENFAAALDSAEKQEVVEISIPRSAVEGVNLRPGLEVQLDARSTPAGLFAHPDRVRVLS